MPQSLAENLVHTVFRTKSQQSFLSQSVQESPWRHTQGADTQAAPPFQGGGEELCCDPRALPWGHILRRFQRL